MLSAATREFRRAVATAANDRRQAYHNGADTVVISVRTTRAVRDMLAELMSRSETDGADHGMSGYAEQILINHLLKHAQADS